MVFKGHEYKNEVSVSKNLNLALDGGAAHRNNWREPRNEPRRVAVRIDYEKTWKNVCDKTKEWLMDASDPFSSTSDSFAYFYICNTIFTVILYCMHYFLKIDYNLWTFLLGCAFSVDIFSLISFRTQIDKLLCVVLFLVHAAPITVYAVVKTAATTSFEKHDQNIREIQHSVFACFCGFLFASLSIIVISFRSVVAIHNELANREFQRVINA